MDDRDFEELVRLVGRSGLRSEGGAEPTAQIVTVAVGAQLLVDLLTGGVVGRSGNRT